MSIRFCSNLRLDLITQELTGLIRGLGSIAMTRSKPNVARVGARRCRIFSNLAHTVRVRPHTWSGVQTAQERTE